MSRTDEIVETRLWRSGTEIVTRVNWTQVARVRRALGFAGDEYRHARLEQASERPEVTVSAATIWPDVDACAA